MFLFCLVGLRQPDPQKHCPSPRGYVAAVCVLHWLLISLYEDWWGGSRYGPRYFADLTPFFVYLLLPVVTLFAREGWRTRPALAVGFLVLVASSFFIHHQGATEFACQEWNMCPSSVRREPWRIWDWRDPQFLRGLRPRFTQCDAD